MRFLIRPADFKDRDGLLRLARIFPLSSLPPNKSQLEKKIQTSQGSFQKTLPKESRNYLFVMEDRRKKKIIASSQILSYFGPHRSICYFLEKKGGQSYLKLKQTRKGQNQNGGLILDPDYRKSPKLLGLQISLARFLYIKTFPKEFSPIIEVSLTAPIQGNKNHFWEETGGKYIKIDYLSALKSFHKDRRDFLQLFPKNLKIPLQKLSLLAKSYMEKVHPQTYPVYKGLLKMGFQPSHRYHLLDGGIYLEAHWKNLAFLKKAKKYVLKKSRPSKPLSSALLAQATKRGFFCAKVKGRKQGASFLTAQIPPGFEEGKKSLALPFSY